MELKKPWKVSIAIPMDLTHCIYLYRDLYMVFVPHLTVNDLSTTYR